jgi:hypothetical protein
MMISPCQSALEAVAEAARKVIDACKELHTYEKYVEGIAFTIEHMRDALATLDALGPADTDDAKEHFLDFLADCKWEIEHDADTDSNGRQVDCSTFTISGSLYSLATFLDALKIDRGYYESWDDALQRHIETDISAPPQRAQEGEG